VTEVSWTEALRFCNLLSQAAGLEPCYAMGDDPDGQDVDCDWAAGGYRLPTEAEWERPVPRLPWRRLV
jgi:formylglycine-generating enzyme required for sulfatase activity